MASSADGGGSWSIAPTAVYGRDFAGARTPSATATGAGFVQSWYAASETVVHAGIDAAADAQRGYGVGTNQSVASDPSGAVVVAWCTAVEGPNGVYVQTVAPATGAPAAPAARMPGSVDASNAGYCPASTRVPLVAETRGGFSVAATDGGRRTLRVWRVGAPRSLVVAGGSSVKQQVALATAGDGRLWVGWSDGSALRLRRSNRAGTRFGATVKLNLPARESVYQLDLAAQGTRVDVLARMQSDAGTVVVFHTQALPGLSLSAVGGRGRASFRVTDAGNPVAAAHIRVAGHTLRTNGEGRARVHLRRGRYLASASKRQYVGADAGLRVR
jgi:hypothetical protein